MRTFPALVIAALAACGPPDQALVPEAEPEALRTPSHLVDSTVSEPFGPPDLIARPLQLIASDRYLFIIDISPPHVHVLDAVTGAHRRSFGREGEGPGDFPHAPLGVARSARGDTVWFYHALQGRLSGVAIQDLADETRPTVSATRQVSPGAWTFAIDGPDAAGNLLALNQTPTGIETLTYSLADDRITRRGALALSDERMDASSLGDAYAGHLCHVPDRDVWLDFYLNVGRADVLDVSGASRGEVPVPFTWLPHVEESTRHPGRMIFSSYKAGTRHAYTGCAVTERFVYALYQGHLTGDREVKEFFDRWPLAEVQVFDMSFQLVKTFVLDHPTAVLAVAPGDSVLFSVWEDATGPQVRKTRVP